MVTFAVLRRGLPGLGYYFFAAFFLAAFFLPFFFLGSAPLSISSLLPILSSPFCWVCAWSTIREQQRRTSLELRAVYRFSFEVSITSTVLVPFLGASLESYGQSGNGLPHPGTGSVSLWHAHLARGSRAGRAPQRACPAGDPARPCHLFKLTHYPHPRRLDLCE